MNKTNAELDAKIVQLDAEEEAEAEAERRAQPPDLPRPTEPLQVVREFVENRCRHGDDLIFRYWRGGWWLWQTSHWVEVNEGTLRSELYHFTEKAHYINNSGKRMPWAPTTSKINNLLDALKAICLLGADIAIVAGRSPGQSRDRGDSQRTAGRQ